MPRPANETKPRQFRLDEETLGQLDRIAEYYGLTRTDAIRIAAREMTERLPRKATPKKGTAKKNAT